MKVDEAELDNFLVQPAPPAGEEEEQQEELEEKQGQLAEEQEANQDRHLDKKNVTRRGLLKVFLFIIESSILFDPFHQHFLFDVVLPILFLWFLEVQCLL